MFEIKNYLVSKSHNMRQSTAWLTHHPTPPFLVACIYSHKQPLPGSNTIIWTPWSDSSEPAPYTNMDQATLSKTSPFSSAVEFVDKADPAPRRGHGFPNSRMMLGG